MNVITERYSLYEGDCLEVMKTFEANSIDTVICDPPYGLKFMSKNWDHGIPGVPFWAEMLRVAKPGAILMAFGGTRTHHRLMVAIEDAGWELRDTLMWLYGSGFPKALNISAAIDSHLGAKREVIGSKMGLPGYSDKRDTDESGYGGGWKDPKAECAITSPSTDAAKEFSGWYSGLKPAWEPIIVAMKPLTSTFSANALAHGVAGLNIDGCRIGDDTSRVEKYNGRPPGGKNSIFYGDGMNQHAWKAPAGRWPANLILSQSAAALLDEMSGESKSSGIYTVHQHNNTGTGFIGKANRPDNHKMYDDTGGASRYFTVLPDSEPRFCYTAKASTSERNEGLDGLPESVSHAAYGEFKGTPEHAANTNGSSRNPHPTVKPLSLMRWLVRLTKTPTGGSVLDPFGGSGTTVIACLLEGRHCTYIDKEREYFEITRHRSEHWQDEASTEPRKLRGKDSDLSGMPLFADIGG